MIVLILNDTTNWYHFGCTGTSTALKTEISKLHYDVRTFSIADARDLNNLPTTVQEFFDPKWIDGFNASNPVLAALLQKSDIVVVNGEGTLHGPKHGPLALLFMAYIAKKLFKKHVQIINHSVYPDDSLSVADSETVRLYKTVYGYMDFVAIREPLSLAVMRRLGLQVDESFDCLLLYIKDNYLKTWNKQENLILFSGTAAWFNLNVFIPGAKPSDHFMEGLRQVVDLLQAKKTAGYEVKFLYSVTNNPAEDDQQMLTFLDEYTGNSFACIRASSIGEWLQCIEEAGLLIPGRFHHSIAAACLGTKFIALNSNTPKVTGLMQAMNCQPPLLYSDPQLRGKLLSAIDAPNPCANSDLLLDSLCEKAQNNFTGLRYLIV